MNDYMDMDYTDLFSMVFDKDRQIKACGRDACLEMMERLKAAFGSLYGDENTGRLMMPDAYKAACTL